MTSVGLTQMCLLLTNDSSISLMASLRPHLSAVSLNVSLAITLITHTAGVRPSAKTLKDSHTYPHEQSSLERDELERGEGMRGRRRHHSCSLQSLSAGGVQAGAC